MAHDPRGAMTPIRSLILLAMILGTSTISQAWGAEDFSMPFQCKPQFHGQAQFTEGTANYDIQGLCGYVDNHGNYSSVWTFYGKGTYIAGIPMGKGQEHYTFTSPQGTVDLQLTMDCYSDPWIDDGLCTPNTLRMSWKGSVPPQLMRQFSPNGPVAPPFSASYLRGDRTMIQNYKAQRQTYLAQLQRERKPKISGVPKQIPGALAQTIDAPYMPTILSPAEGAQFVRGGPVLLMVKSPEKDSLGTVVQVEFQYCVFDQAKGACNWIPQGIEGRVNVSDLLAAPTGSPHESSTRREVGNCGCNARPTLPHGWQRDIQAAGAGLSSSYPEDKRVLAEGPCSDGSRGGLSAMTPCVTCESTVRLIHRERNRS